MSTLCRCNEVNDGIIPSLRDLHHKLTQTYYGTILVKISEFRFDFQLMRTTAAGIRSHIMSTLCRCYEENAGIIPLLHDLHHKLALTYYGTILSQPHFA